MTEYKSKVKYEAPIEINIEEDFPDYGSMAVSEIENMICSAVLKVGITVDKEELIKALRYDRGQYEKGYADGKRDAADAIEALQAQLPKRGEWVEDTTTYAGPGLSNYKCSLCGNICGTWRRGLKPSELPNWCGNCGADMRKMEVSE